MLERYPCATLAVIEDAGHALMHERPELFADLVASGEDPAVPLAERHYPGRFNIRISPDLHRELTIRAADHHMSLNRFVSDRLARD